MINKELITKKDYQSIVKHNNLVQGRYSLEASEQKFLYKLFEHVQKNQYKTRELELSFKDFYRDFKDVLGKNITRADFKNLVESTQDKKPYIIIGDEFTRTQWYKIKGKINYDKIKLILEEEVFEYIKEQEKNFTMLRLESVYSFKKFYTMRIYELLKQWSNTKKVIKFSVEDLKKTLNIEDNSGYKNFNNIEKRIIKPAVSEINEKSELKISYETKKEGRKVSEVTFYILEQLILCKYINNKNEEEIHAVSNKEKDVKDNEETLVAIKEVQAYKKFENEAKETKEFYIPEDTILNFASKRAFTRDFKEYDFNKKEYKEAFYDAEEIVIERDNVLVVEKKSYNLFKTILISNIEILELKHKEEEDFKNKIGQYLS